MSALEENLKRVQDKLQHLLKQYQLLQKDNERQRLLIHSLQTDKEKTLLQITAMEQQVNILKLAAGEMNAEDKKAFEKNINQYIREIDKCISSLSN